MVGKRRNRRGVSAIEFAMLTVVWVPLLLGTLAVGSTMIRAMEAVQVARDAGHMYARGVDFAFPGNRDMLVRLGSELGFQASGGPGGVVLSTISYVGRQECKALGLADNSTPPNPTAACTNYQHFVFTHRITVGNTTVAKSAVGDPADGLVNANTGYLTRDDYTKNVGARADKFALLPKPKEDGTDGFQAGQMAYLVEAIFNAPDFPGFMTGNRTYTHALF